MNFLKKDVKILGVNPYDKAHELARAITTTETYKKYIAAKEEIENNPEFIERILKFREKQIELNRLQMMGEETEQTLVTQVAEEFNQLNQIPQVANFFNAEVGFITLFNDIQQIIQQKIESGF